jgi:hypothetical protein
MITKNHFLRVGLTLNCRGDAALRGGGRVFPDLDGLVVIGADADIGDDVLSIPKEDWDFETDDAEVRPPVPEYVESYMLKLPKNFWESWEDRMQPGARCSPPAGTAVLCLMGSF